MSYFKCSDGTVHRPFGTGKAAPLGKDYGIEDIVCMPIDPAIAQSSEDGTPLVVSDPDHEASKTYMGLAEKIVGHVLTLRNPETSTELTVATFDAKRGIVLRRFGPDGAKEDVLSPYFVRTRCPTLRVLAMEGVVSDAPDIRKDVLPTAFEPRGNYAVAITWDDNLPTPSTPSTSLPHWSTTRRASRRTPRRQVGRGGRRGGRRGTRKVPSAAGGTVILTAANRATVMGRRTTGTTEMRTRRRTIQPMTLLQKRAGHLRLGMWVRWVGAWSRVRSRQRILMNI